MKTWQLVVFGLLCGLLAAGGIPLISLPNRGCVIDLAESAPEGIALTYSSNTSAIDLLTMNGLCFDSIEELIALRAIIDKFILEVTK